MKRTPEFENEQESWELEPEPRTLDTKKPSLWPGCSTSSLTYSWRWWSSPLVRLLRGEGERLGGEQRRRDENPRAVGNRRANRRRLAVGYSWQVSALTLTDHPEVDRPSRSRRITQKPTDYPGRRPGPRQTNRRVKQGPGPGQGEHEGKGKLAGGPWVFLLLGPSEAAGVARSFRPGGPLRHSAIPTFLV